MFGKDKAQKKLMEDLPQHFTQVGMAAFCDVSAWQPVCGMGLRMMVAGCSPGAGILPGREGNP